MKRRPSPPRSREFLSRVFRGKTCRPSRLLLPLALSVSALAPGAFAASVTWDGDAAVGTAGDGFLWTNPFNWSGDLLPAITDDLSFGNPLATVGTIILNGNQTANSLTFTESYKLGAYGTSNVLTNASGNVAVTAGDFGTINAAYSGPALNLSGGVTLFLNHPSPAFAGNITVDGAGTTLLHKQEGPTVQYNAIGGSQEFGRFDPVTLGVTPAVKNITLTNGGTYKIINTGNNPEGNFKNIIIGAGGGTLDLAAGYILQNLDDTGQITATTNAFTKAGKGRLVITGTMATVNPLGGIVNINGGMLSLDNQASQTVGANTYVRFVGIAGTGTTVNINNGGTLLLNNGTQATFDVPTINANNGSIIAFNSNDHIIGYSVAGGASSVTNLNIDGTVSLLTRDLFAPQNQRFPRMRAALTGTGILDLIPNTNAGGTPRLVIERGVGSTFSGTFRLNENESLEANPRNNATVDVGKVIADGDIEFAGWGGTLDVRDSNPTTSVLDYTTNEITITTSQAGALNVISSGRATTATGTGSLVNFGTLTMGNHRLIIAGNNSYQTGFADTASIQGDAVIIMNSDNSPAVFSNAAAISENAAGRSLTILKSGVSSSGSRDVIVGGGISVSNVNVTTGTLQLRGANGAIGTAFGGAAPTITINGAGIAGNGNTLPSAGLLHLDSNTGHVVGLTPVIGAANSNDRIVDTATLNMRSNSTLRLTSFNNAGTTETIGTTNVSGHATFDIVKTGTALTPVALTLSTLTLGTNATANFTGTSLGTAGVNTSRIVIPGIATGFLGSAFHSGNEFAKYDATLDNGFDIGVTPFVAGDYTTNTAENTWAAGQVLKQSGATGQTLTANRNADRLNLQFSAANQSINTNGFVLSLNQGGLMQAANLAGIIGNAGLGGLTAGTTAPASLYAHTSNTLEIMVPVTNNLGLDLAPGGGDDNAVTFVKSGTGTVILSHHSRTVGQGVLAAAPFTTATWSSTNTGGWVINDGMLNVHRGQFLGATPTTVTLNGGQLEINEPVSNANDATIIPGWGHHIVVNGNAMLGDDDNGESADGNTGDRTLVKLGSLTINNGSLMGMAAFSDNDIAFMGGATFNGRPALNIGAGSRSGVNNANIISGVLAGTGFDVLALGGNGATLVLGGTQIDTTHNTYNGQVVIYGATVRLNKANGFTALTDGSASEDVVINGGNLFWGPGHFGDLLTTNQVGRTDSGLSIAGTNNGGLFGIAPTSPAAIRAAGMNQIADTATVTLLTGTLGESDRITNETFGALIQKNGTFNVGLGKIQVNSATISGGAFNIDRGGTFKAGTLSLLPGAPDLNITTGLTDGVNQSVLEIGSGGVSLTGQNIILGTGSNGNTMGSGAVLKLGGNLTHTGTDLIGGSYGRKGIFIQTGSTFRQLGNSKIDLAGGTRDFNIDTDSIFFVTAPLTNGGISKSGGGNLSLEPYQASTFTGPVIVNAGVLEAKGDGAFGTSAGGVTIASGATVKLNSSWTYGDDFTVTGPGAIIPGSGSVREVGALVALDGTSHLTGAVVLGGDATLAGDVYLDPSVTPGAGGLAYRIGTLRIEGAAGVTGTGTLGLSGHGDGVIANGVNTSSGGLTKDGAGRWTLAGAGSYVGATTISAGALRISNGAALGATSAGTSVYGGGSLELIGGISVAEPLTISGDGPSVQSGAIVNVGGNNTLTGPITLLGTTLRSDSGTLMISNSITGGATALTLSGAGNGVVSGAISAGPPAAGNVLTKNGTGSWTLSGANALNGSTAVNGGTLTLSSAGAALGSASALNMGGGNLVIAGSAQTVNGLNLLAGGGTVNGGAGLSVGAISRSVGATANFAGTVTTSSGNTNGILGGYATTGADWATVNGGNVVAFSGYTPLSENAAANTDNSSIGNPQLQKGNVTTNSLKIAGGGGLQLGANNLVVTSGGLLANSSVTGGIGGTGTLSGASANDELIIHNTGAKFGVGAALIGAGSGSLTKTGSGDLFLFGTSSFTGSVNVNGGALIIPGAPAFPGTLGNAVVAANRLININGGTLGVQGDWDINDFDGVTAGIQSLQFNIGPAGGTLKALFGSNLTINDGSATPGVATQLMGSGDLTFAGGGRYTLSGGVPQFTGFTGNVTVDGGILTVGHSESLGGRQTQVVTLNPGSAIINATGFGLGLNGLPNNVVAGGGVEFFAQGGNRVFGGDIQLSGTNTIALFERDTIQQERQVYFNGRVSGTGITLNVFGSNNNNPFYLASGSNAITGAINLNANAVLEARSPGSLGINSGDVTINMATNSRLLLRHWQNGDYRANVVVNGHAEINSDRLANYGGGAQQFLSINELTVNGDNNIVSFGGGNNYYTRIAGRALLNGPTNTILNITASDVIFENGLTLGTPSSTIDKRGGFTAILRAPTIHTGTLIIQGGLIHLQDSGTLPSTSTIELRGGELRVDNGNSVNGNRINDAAAINLGGGTLRLTGTETLGVVTAKAGTTQIIYNPTSETVATPLTLTGFTRQTGAVVQFQAPDLGLGAVGQATIGSPRVSSRILIPGQANVTGTADTIPGLFGNNNLDFIQYDGTTMDSGAPLGVRDVRNPGSSTAQFAVPYVNDQSETAWSDATVLRLTTSPTLTANRSLDAVKIEAANLTITQGANDLRIENGGIISATATATITSTTGRLYAGKAVATAGVAELFVGGNSAININSNITNNPLSGQEVALVKTGTNQLNLNNTIANTYSGGTYVNSGTLNTTTNNAFGSGPIYLNGGTLLFNIANAASALPLGGLGNNIEVNASSQITLDNGALAGTDNDLAFGSLKINGPYTLRLLSFDSMDASFTGTHVFAGLPTIDMTQAASGGNGTGFFALNGAITGSGFFIGGSGATNDTTSILQIGGGEATANTYSGKVTVLLGVSSVGSNSEDLVVQLNKAAGTTAITGDLEINGGVVRNMFNEQIANTSNLVINQGQYDANGKNETIASVTMRGGNFRTSSGATGNSTVTVTGNFDISGADDLTGSGDGVAANSNTTLTILGTLRMNGYGKGTVGGTASTMNLGGLEMTGTTLLENGAGSLIRLNGDVTTFASSNVARLGATTTAGAQVQLNGARRFTVADGSAGIDLSVSSALTDSTSPAASGSFIKAGPGTLQFEGAGLANAYTGTTTVSEGALVLFKSNGVNAIPAGALTIGDGIGGANADKVILRNSNQIADGNNVTIASSGLLDLFSFNTSEQIHSLSGSGNIELGPSSTLTVSGITSTSFSGSIGGPGALTKSGLSTLMLSGPNTFSGSTTINQGVLEIGGSGALTGTTSVTVNPTGTLLLSGGSERINNLASLTLAGGVFNAGGFSETIGMLNLTANSIIDFGAGSSFLFFADSSAVSWNSSARLSLWNWSGNVYIGGGTDRIHFGNGTSLGLTSSQLAQIDFYSDAGLTQYSITPAFSSNAFVGSFGEVVPVPEPTAMGVAMGLLGLIGWRERRRARASHGAGRA